MLLHCLSNIQKRLQTGFSLGCGWAESNNDVEEMGIPTMSKALKRWKNGDVAQSTKNIWTAVSRHGGCAGALSGRAGFDRFISGLTNQAAQWYLFICKLMSYIKYGGQARRRGNSYS